MVSAVMAAIMVSAVMAACPGRAGPRAYLEGHWVLLIDDVFRADFRSCKHENYSPFRPVFTMLYHTDLVRVGAQKNAYRELPRSGVSRNERPPTRRGPHVVRFFVMGACAIDVVAAQDGYHDTSTGIHQFQPYAFEKGGPPTL